MIQLTEHGLIPVLAALGAAAAALGEPPESTGTTDQATASSHQATHRAHRVSEQFSNSGPLVITHPHRDVPPVASPGTTALYTDREPEVLPDSNYIVPPEDDPFRFLEDGTMFVRSLAAKLNLSFMPQMVYTYQHATRVMPGNHHGYSHIYTNINGAAPLDVTSDDPNGHFIYNIQGNSGLGASTYPFINDAVGSPYFLNDVLTSGRLSLKKLWWNQKFFDDRLTVNVGKLYYANFFDLNAGAQNPTKQFLAAQLTNNTAVPYASYGFGAVGEWAIDKESFIRFGTMNALASGRSTGFEKLDEGRLFNMAQFTWMPKLDINESSRQGHYRGFVWYSNNDVSYEKKGWGAGISFDQELGGGFTGFLRWGWAQDGAAPATACWSTGFVLNGVMGRKLDGVGIGCTFTDLKDSGTASGRGWETIVEAFWRIQVTRTLAFSPDVQYFVSGEEAGVGNTWIWGLRCTWEF